MQPTLQTERLTLRPFALADADNVQRLAGDRRIADTTSDIPHPYRDGEAEAWISRHASQFQEKEAVVFAVVFETELVGAVSIVNISMKHRLGELGYWVGCPYWGRNYCTEAVRELLTFATGELDLSRIEARCFVRNVASARVLEKCGFSLEGTLRQYAAKWQSYEDVHIYGRLFGERAAT